MFDSSEVKVL